MAKSNEFKWKSQQQLGAVEVNEKEKKVVSLCSLDILEKEDGEMEERWYVSISTWKYFKKREEPVETWRPVKGATVPLDCWDEINDLVQKACEGDEE